MKDGFHACTLRWSHDIRRGNPSEEMERMYSQQTCCVGKRINIVIYLSQTLDSRVAGANRFVKLLLLDGFHLVFSPAGFASVE